MLTVLLNAVLSMGQPNGICWVLGECFGRLNSWHIYCFYRHMCLLYANLCADRKLVSCAQHYLFCCFRFRSEQFFLLSRFL